MTIDVLLAGNDEHYIRKLAEIIKTREIRTDDTLKLAYFTDEGRLRDTLNSRREFGRRAKYHVALVDEELDVSSLSIGDVPLVFVLTDESDKDGRSLKTHEGQSALYLYKYQRISGIVDKIILESAKKRSIERKGSAALYTFFSPAGGSGTSTAAAAFAVMLAQSGIKPLYVSFEAFNGTEALFNSDSVGKEGLYDVFYSIMEGGSAVAVIDSVRVQDPSGVMFLNRFPMWTEITQITSSTMETFVEAARGSAGIGAVVLDLGSSYAQFTERVMDLADTLFIVADSSPVSQVKLKMLMTDNTYFLSEFVNKSEIIYNKIQRQRMPSDNFGVKTAYVQFFHVGSPSELLTAVAAELGGQMRRG